MIRCIWVNTYNRYLQILQNRNQKIFDHIKDIKKYNKHRTKYWLKLTWLQPTNLNQRICDIFLANYYRTKSKLHQYSHRLLKQYDTAILKQIVLHFFSQYNLD